ncbi:MAG: efflux RND transporter periplasmic adaptor subunit [Candidatus Paceibacterota bacterium]|jgi:RND family efflux transporter MFP subunit
MNIINKTKGINRKYLLYGVIGLIIVVVFFATRTGKVENSEQVIDEPIKVISVFKLGDKIEGTSVFATGSVVSEQQADLKSQASGEIMSVNVRVGDVVSKGQSLITLENSSIKSQVEQAEALVAVQKAQLAELKRRSADGAYIGNIEQQQKISTENAYANLLSADLIAEPDSDLYSQTAPIISGRYSGSEEGTYKIIFERGKQMGDYEMNIFKLETVRDVEINKTGPTPFGTRGLYISFPDSIDTYMDTIWYVDIPNKKSDSYIANYNAYLLAKESIDTTIQQSTVSEEQIVSQEAQVAQAEANLSSAKTAFSKTIIRAPFSGDVIAVPVSIGEYINIGQTVVSLTNKSGIYIKAFLSSSESKKIEVGSDVLINNDYKGVVSNISSGINPINGKVEVLIVPENTEKSFVIGEFVNVEIYVKNIDNTILTVPLKSIRPRADASVVYIYDNSNKIVIEKEVETGNIKGESIEIFTDLLSETLIAESARGLKDGMRVEIKN